MYSVITNNNIQITCPYIDSTSSTDYAKYKTLCSGVQLLSNSAYAADDGTVLWVGKISQGLYTVTVQHNAYQCTSYCSLISVDVKEGEFVKQGTRLGSCRKQFRFEYLTSSNSQSVWAVRLRGLVYYKQNPMPVIDGDIKLTSSFISNKGHNTQTVFESTP